MRYQSVAELKMLPLPEKRIDWNVWLCGSCRRGLRCCRWGWRHGLCCLLGRVCGWGWWGWRFRKQGFAGAAKLAVEEELSQPLIMYASFGMLAHAQYSSSRISTHRTMSAGTGSSNEVLSGQEKDIFGATTRQLMLTCISLLTVLNVFVKDLQVSQIYESSSRGICDGP